MKKISTGGITFLEPLEGAENLYFGTDAPCGDIYRRRSFFGTAGASHLADSSL